MTMTKKRRMSMMRIRMLSVRMRMRFTFKGEPFNLDFPEELQDTCDLSSLEVLHECK